MPARKASRPPEPELEQDPAELDEASQGEDEGSSTASSAASDFIADPGPEFDPDQAAEDAGERDADRAFTAHPGGETGLVIEWAEDTVRSLLEAQGVLLHGAIGKAEDEWIYTKQELSTIAKPLTRILNRYDATRVAAGTGDEIALILGLFGYVMRSLQERKAALALIKAAEGDTPAGEPTAEFGIDPSMLPTQEDPTQ